MFFAKRPETGGGTAVAHSRVATFTGKDANHEKDNDRTTARSGVDDTHGL